MYYYRYAQTPAKTDKKSELSKMAILRLLISILVAPFGGKARIILSVERTFQSKSAMAATRQVYRTVGSLMLAYLEQKSMCLRK